MKIKSKPFYFSFIIQENCPFLNSAINKKLLTLTSNLSWIDALEKEDNEIYSRDYFDCDFPHRVDWPKDWQDGINAAINEADNNLKKHLLSAEKHRLGSDVSIYILDEEVYLSTQYYANESITKMKQVEKYDSVVTAVYIYINEYKRWEKKYKSTYDAANILSSADNTYAASQIGISQECEGCGCYGLIVQEDENHNVYCATCAKL